MNRFVLALLVFPALAIADLPRITYTYADHAPTAMLLGENFAAIPFTPYVMVFVNTQDPSVDGFLVTLTYTDATGVERAVSQSATRTPNWTTVLFVTGPATKISPSARPYRFTGDVIVPNPH